MARGIVDDDDGTKAPPPDEREELFRLLIPTTKLRMAPELAMLVPKTDCFGRSWADQEGVCPVATDCDLAKYCEHLYNEVGERIRLQNELKGLPPAVLDQVLAQKAKDALREEVEDAKKRKLDKSKAPPAAPAPPRTPPRGIHKGTGKYQRLGYTYQGRPVDEALAVVLDRLGRPPVLPKNWNPTNFFKNYASLGRLVISQTASYTAFLVDGVTVMRFWTNAGTHALVDMVTELTDQVKQIITKKKGVVIAQVPDGSKKKLKPCTFRLQMSGTTDEQKQQAEDLVVAFKQTFGII
jgi:hypothetical protein